MLDIDFYVRGRMRVSIKSDKDIVVISDQSATGKTLLFSIVQDYYYANGMGDKILYINSEEFSPSKFDMIKLLDNEELLIIMDDADSYIEPYVQAIKSAKAKLVICLKCVGCIEMTEDMSLGYVVNERDYIRYEKGLFLCYIRRLRRESNK